MKSFYAALWSLIFGLLLVPQPARGQAGLDPVGEVKAPGCRGIEIIGYATGKMIPFSGMALNYIGLRNSSPIEQVVDIQIERLNARRVRITEVVHVSVKPGLIAQKDVSLGTPPSAVRILRCV